MNKHQIVNCVWQHRESGKVITITRKGSVPQTFNYSREVSAAEGGVVYGFIGKSELKTNWVRLGVAVVDGSIPGVEDTSESMGAPAPVLNPKDTK